MIFRGGGNKGHEDMQQLDLFAPAQPLLQPVDPDGDVVHGSPDLTLRLPHPRLAWDLATIQIHQHEDNTWMWAVSCAGGGYKVGPKWGRFAATQEEATRFAAAELLEKAQGRSSQGMSISEREHQSILDFARGFLT